MTKKNFLVKHKGTLIPATDEDSKIIYNLEEGDMVAFTTNDARKLWRHNKFWRLLNKVVDYMPEEISNICPSADMLLINLKKLQGYVKTVVTIDGESTTVVDSINFATMGEKRFKEFVSKAEGHILEYFLPISAEDFEREFKQLMM